MTDRRLVSAIKCGGFPTSSACEMSEFPTWAIVGSKGIRRPDESHA
jgi:hypothetical protein